MIDPMTRAEFERDIDILADPDLQIACGADHGNFSIMFVRRRGASLDPDFRFRDPDSA